MEVFILPAISGTSVPYFCSEFLFYHDFFEVCFFFRVIWAEWLIENRFFNSFRIFFELFRYLFFLFSFFILRIHRTLYALLLVKFIVHFLNLRFVILLQSVKFLDSLVLELVQLLLMLYLQSLKVSSHIIKLLLKLFISRVSFALFVGSKIVDNIIFFLQIKYALNQLFNLLFFRL